MHIKKKINPRARNFSVTRSHKNFSSGGAYFPVGRMGRWARPEIIQHSQSPHTPVSWAGTGRHGQVLILLDNPSLHSLPSFHQAKEVSYA